MKVSKKKVLEILYNPITFDLDKEDEKIVTDYLYLKDKEGLDKHDTNELTRLFQKYKKGVRSDLELLGEDIIE